jgi:transposase
VEHVAIDLGGKESQVCIRDGTGGIVLEDRVATAGLRRILDRPMARVVLETCAEAFGVADLALEYGHDVRVVPASLVKSLGVGARRTKTDRRDARVLSEVSCRVELPSVHVPSHWSREAKSLCGMRDALVSCRTKIINSVRGYLRRTLKRMPVKGSRTTLPKRVRTRFMELGTPVPAHVERQLKTIEQLNENVKQATEDVASWAEANPTCVRLMTAPGVGALTALRFVAAIDRIERFPDAHHLEAYLGLTPGEDSSSERKRITSITKAGPTAVRWTLVQAAWTALRVRPEDPMCSWALQVSRRRGPRVAVVALARKLAGVLYAMWRDGTEYQRCRAPTSEVLARR